MLDDKQAQEPTTKGIRGTREESVAGIVRRQARWPRIVKRRRRYKTAVRLQSATASAVSSSATSAGAGNMERGTERVKGDYDRYFADQARSRTRPVAARQMVCTAPITYTGQAEIQSDVENLQSALSGVSVAEAFMASVGPDNVGYQPEQNEFYATEEEYIRACAEAMREEYKAIADAGFVLQVDTPVMKFNALAMELPDSECASGSWWSCSNHTCRHPGGADRLHIATPACAVRHPEDINSTIRRLPASGPLLRHLLRQNPPRATSGSSGAT